MRVLYLCNAIPDMVMKHAAIEKKEVGGGWVESMLSLLLETGQVEASIAVPLPPEDTSFSGVTESGLKYFSFPKQEDRIDYNAELVDFFKMKIKEIKPDIVHIFGTEYPYALSMVQACNYEAAVPLISIQGVLIQCVNAYLLALPEKYIRKGFPGSNRILYYRAKMKRRATCEKELLNKIVYVTGRTNWDCACTKQINPNLQYLYCNEVLRKEFYDGTMWSAQSCVRHRIFLSQASYPIKGAHVLLRNLSSLIKKYPDLSVHIGGYPPMDTVVPQGLKQLFIRKVQSLLLKTGIVRNYPAYVQALMKKYALESRIHFCGPLSAAKMKQEYLQANVFVSCSTIENSPNSLGEAMMLGVPILSSCVGGVPDMLTHGKEGYLFPLSEEYLLPYYIDKLFENDALCLKLGEEANSHAKKIFDVKINSRQMLQHYNTICAVKTMENA